MMMMITTPIIALIRKKKLSSFIRASISPLGEATSRNQFKLMSLDYRLVHLLGIISLALLLPTGSTDNGAPFLPFHIYFGLVSVGLLGIYSGIMIARKRVRMFDALRAPLNSQIREGMAVVMKYLLGTPYPAPIKSGFGRYNILATYASLVLVLSFVPLMVGGIAMVFVSRGTFLYEEMKVLHLFGVGLIALFFLVHVFAVLKSENRPLLKAMIYNGKVRMDWAAENLSQYIRKVYDSLSN